MKKADGRTKYEVRRLCRDIYNHRDRLQTLLSRLQEVLRQNAPDKEAGEERYASRAVKGTARSDNPFDKIMVV